MTELRTFAPHDLISMGRLGQMKEANAIKMGASQAYRFRGDASASTDGIKGEWAVADSLGVPRCENTTGRADPGYDLTGPAGSTIQVRFTPYRSGRLMCLATHPIRADAAVLVTASPDASTVRIVGGAWRTDFYRRCHRRDFGHGPTDYLEQDELIDWLDLKGQL